jgi:hypothetical protein
VQPPSGEWICLSLDFEAPPQREPQFNSGGIDRVGLGIDGQGSVRVFIDQVAY